VYKVQGPRIPWESCPDLERSEQIHPDTRNSQDSANDSKLLFTLDHCRGAYHLTIVFLLILSTRFDPFDPRLFRSNSTYCCSNRVERPAPMTMARPEQQASLARQVKQEMYVAGQAFWGCSTGLITEEWLDLQGCARGAGMKPNSPGSGKSGNG